MQISTTENLAKRFGHRLNMALDAMGMSPAPLDRARGVASALELDVSMVAAMLSGLLLPDWGVLLKVCKHSDREPGYFLDDAVAQYPIETRSVKPLGPGENIVVRIPPKSTDPWGGADDDWTYVQAKGPMGFGVKEGDYVVNFAPANQHTRLERNFLYLLGIDNHLEIRRCDQVEDGLATMVGINPVDHSEQRRFLPVQKSSQEVTPEILSRVNAHHLGVVSLTIRRSKLMLAQT